MGSGRKRPLDNRIPAPSKEGDGRKKKKGKKSKDKNKEAASTSEQTHKTSLESTTTAEGKIMAQVCSTFNRLEQSRFEAFRRAALPSDAISKYVAHCLIDEHTGGGAPTRRAPILSELCAPGQADEICIVVSTLAKAYAQRLVTAARRLTDSSADEPIQPEHILQAYHNRQANGLDPGFFLQAAPSSTKVLLKDETYNRKRLATLKAQEDYDKLYPPMVTEEENAGEDPMDISSPSKSTQPENPLTPQHPC